MFLTYYFSLLENTSATPIEVQSSEEMNALLIPENVGNVYKYVGVTNATYINSDLYEVVSE